MTPLAECLRGANALSALEPEWKALVDECGASNPFLSWEWASAWWECFGDDAEPRIVCVRDAASGRLLCLAPLVLRALPVRRAPLLRELSWLGGGASGADHLDAIASPQPAEPVLETLLDALAAIPHDVLRLEGVAPAGVLRRAIDGARASWVRERPCPYAPLPRSWQEFFDRLPGRLRYSLRSRALRLERDSAVPVAYETVRGGARIYPALEALFALHQKVRAQHQKVSRFATGRALEFHRRVARSFADRGWLRLHLLRVGARVVAASYCFHAGDRVLFFQTGYEPTLARYGLGAAIVAHSIRHAIEEGAHEFDFLRGDEPYKLQFTRRVRKDLRAWIACTGRGRAAIAAYRVGRGVRNRWLHGAPRPMPLELQYAPRSRTG